MGICKGKPETKESPMRKITDIKPQKRNRKRYNIYIDGDFAFGVSENVLVRHRLVVGSELTDAYIDEVILAEEQNRANNYALRLLGYRARSEHEIRSRMRQRGYEDSTIENTVQYLKGHNYIDDYAFARAFVNDEINLKYSGKSLIMHRLLQKGVSRQISQEVLEEVYDDEKAFATCMGLAEKKLNTTYRRDPHKDQVRKVVGFLQRRGYPYSMIRRVVEELLGWG